MKAVMIVLDQAHYDEIVENLKTLNIRGFTSWREVHGRGSKNGIPRYGSHEWPSVNNSIHTIVEDDRLPLLLKYLNDLDNDSASLGLRAFGWNIEGMI